MNEYPVDELRKRSRYLSIKDRNKLLHLMKRFGKGKRNYVVKVRYVESVMRHRRMKNLFSILNQNPKLYWPALFQCIKQNDSTPPSFDFVWGCAVAFLDELLAVGCGDANVVERILKLYGFYCASKHRYLSYEVPSTEFYTDICSIFHNDSICNCGFTNNVAHFDVDLHEFALRAKDLKFMDALLKYGTNIPRRASCRKWLEIPKQLFEFWLRWMYPVGITKLLRDGIWENVYDGNKRGYRRLFLITKMLRILDIKWCRERKGGPGLERNRHPLATYPVYTDKEFNDSVRCMKLYFRSTVEPLISKDDIVEFITSTPLWCGVPVDFLASVGQDYENLFPEQSSGPYSPRSLQHLCRYSLRQSLAEKKVGVLPELVQNLFYPKQLKSYLLCEH